MKVLVFRGQIFYILKNRIYDGLDNSIKFESPNKSFIYSFSTENDSFITYSDLYKNLYLLNQNFEIIKSFQCKKLLSFISLCPNSSPPLIYTADNTGDITLYGTNEKSKEKEEREEKEKERNTTNTINEEGQVIFGHLSIITSLQVSKDWILTADRDEKIRLSHKSKPFLIEAFLLGHRTFISKARMIRDDLIYSIDGDGLLIKWKKQFDSDDSSSLSDSSFNSRFRFVIDEEIQLPQKDPIDMIQVGDRLCIAFDNSNKIMMVPIEGEKDIESNENSRNGGDGDNNEIKSKKSNENGTQIVTITFSDDGVVVTGIANLNNVLIVSMSNGQIIDENMNLKCQIIKEREREETLDSNILTSDCHLEKIDNEITDDMTMVMGKREKAWKKHLRKNLTRKYTKKNNLKV